MGDYDDNHGFCDCLSGIGCCFNFIAATEGSNRGRWAAVFVVKPEDCPSNFVAWLPERSGTTWCSRRSYCPRNKILAWSEHPNEAGGGEELSKDGVGDPGGGKRICHADQWRNRSG
jgi:hypothetical protein